MPRTLPNLEQRRWGRPRTESQVEHPPCPVCHRAVPRRDGESPSRWLTRATCSDKCRGRWATREMVAAAKAKTVQLEAAHPPCPICNDPVLRHSNEHSEKFIERATCGKSECASAWHKIRAKEKRAAMNPGGKSGPHQPAQGVEAEVRLEREPVDYGNGFAAHNLRFKPGCGKMPARPVIQSYGVSSAWGVR